jgi:hypothetical protein
LDFSRVEEVANLGYEESIEPLREWIAAGGLANIQFSAPPHVDDDPGASQSTFDNKSLSRKMRYERTAHDG